MHNTIILSEARKQFRAPVHWLRRLRTETGLGA